MPNRNRTPEHIAECARALTLRYGTGDPFVIAAELGIEVIFVGTLKRLKGMYRVIKGVRFIFLNNANPPQINRIVCAHELGHDQLHRDYARKNPLQEFAICDMATKPEYEANLFAANLLLDDETVLALIAEGCNTEKIASVMENDVNLVALKIDSLIEKGHALRPQMHDTQFLSATKGSL